MERYKIIGLMSGSSLDGVDIACCRFVKKNGRWNYSLEAAQTFSYKKEWHQKLFTAGTLSGEDLIQLDFEYGNFLGEISRKFIIKNRLKGVEFIASHGHTVFHQPQKGYTFQIGNGNAISAVTDLPVISDFRSLDVALGGEGAPLVPVGDIMLFSSHDICINIGGISNISFKSGKRVAAFDICFANMGLNYLAQKKGRAFDHRGKISSKGKIIPELLFKILETTARVTDKRQSLDREIFNTAILPLLEHEKYSVENRMATFTESIAIQIVAALPHKKQRVSILCSGGGVFNVYLIKRIKSLLPKHATLEIPTKEIIKFKEAIIFAFLGLLKRNQTVNVLKSVTDASRDSVSGVSVG